MVANPFSQGLSVKVGGDVSGATGALRGLQGTLVTTGKRVTALGGLFAGALAVGGIAKSTSAAASFDEKMQESMAVMGNVGQTMEDKLTKKAREVANTTTHSAEQAAESYYFLASAGLDASESIAAMPTVAEFAEAGQMDMANATDVATNVMSAYGIEAENMNEVTDTMTKTVTNHNQTMEGLSEAFKNAAPTAAAFGIELEELAGMAGALGDVGIQAGEAGTALNAIMRRFARQRGDVGEVFNELGIEVMDSEGNMRSMVEILGELEDANLNAAESSKLFGRHTSAGNQLLGLGQEQLEEYIAKIDESEGATEKVARTQRQTFNKQLDIAKSRLNDVAIEIGNRVLPMLMPLLDRFNDFVSNSRAIGQAISQYVEPGLKSFTNGISNLFTTAQESDSLSEFIKSLISDATSWLSSNGLDLLKGVGASILSGIADVLSPGEGGEGATDVLNALIKRLKTTLSDISSWLDNGGEGKIYSVITGLMSGLSTSLDNVSQDDVNSVIDSTKSILNSVFDSLIASATSDEAGELGGQIGTLAGQIIKKLGGDLLKYTFSKAFLNDMKLVGGAIANTLGRAIFMGLQEAVSMPIMNAIYGKEKASRLQKEINNQNLRRGQSEAMNQRSWDLNVNVEGDTDVVKNVTAQVVRDQQRQVRRKTGSSQNI